jgi:hypothetical protein
VYVQDDFAYVADATGGLQIFDISDPTNPDSVGSYDVPSLAYDVFVQDSLAYLADRDGGLQIVNVKDPGNPVFINSLDTPGKAYSIFVQDTLVYIADQTGGLRIIGVSDPANPNPVGSYGGTNARGVFVQDSLAYVADYYWGLRVIRITDPGSPQLVGSYNTPGHGLGVSAAGEHVYVTDQYSLIILTNPYYSSVREIDDGETRPSDFVLFQNYPNPFNPTTTVEFLLSRSGQVKIEIYNILGQKVRTLVDENLKAGHKAVDWDGSDDSGQEVASGIYFYRIETAEFSQSKKMLLLK